MAAKKKLGLEIIDELKFFKIGAIRCIAIQKIYLQYIHTYSAPCISILVQIVQSLIQFNVVLLFECLLI